MFKITVILCLLPAAGYCEDAGRYSLDDCVNIAKKNNYRIRES